MRPCLCDVCGYGCSRRIRWPYLRCRTCRHGCWGIRASTEAGQVVIASHLPAEILENWAAVR